MREAVHLISVSETNITVGMNLEQTFMDHLKHEVALISALSNCGDFNIKVLYSYG